MKENKANRGETAPKTFLHKLDIIDQMLDQWIHNSIIRARLRKLIVNAIHTHAETITNTN